MLVPSLVSLTLATVAALFSVNTKDEVFRVSMIFVSGLAVFLTLIFAPLIVKVIIVVFPFVLEKLKYWSA
jgi:hypothetical protein